MGPSAPTAAPVATTPIGNAKEPSQPAATQPVPAASSSTLEIEVEYKFAEARLSIWVDGHLSYSHLLEGTDKKHLVVFHHVQGHEFHAVQVPSGKHRLRVAVASGEPNSEQSGTVTGTFASGKETLLRVTFNNRGEMNLSLRK